MSQKRKRSSESSNPAAAGAGDVAPELQLATPQDASIGKARSLWLSGAWNTDVEDIGEWDWSYYKKELPVIHKLWLPLDNVWCYGVAAQKGRRDYERESHEARAMQDLTDPLFRNLSKFHRDLPKQIYGTDGPQRLTYSVRFDFQNMPESQLKFMVQLLRDFAAEKTSNEDGEETTVGERLLALANTTYIDRVSPPYCLLVAHARAILLVAGGWLRAAEESLEIFLRSWGIEPL